MTTNLWACLCEFYSSQNLHTTNGFGTRKNIDVLNIVQDSELGIYMYHLFDTGHVD